MFSEHVFSDHKLPGNAVSRTAIAAGETVLGLMAKHWQPGQVKTRLGVTIGMSRAAQVHRALVAQLCRALADVADQRMLAIAPATQIAAVVDQLQRWGVADSWQTIDQGDGDLGDRMQRWFQQVLGTASPALPSRRAILIGADCPLLGPNQIEQALAALVDHDVVLGPAADGGYYLIGLKTALGPNVAGRQPPNDSLPNDAPPNWDQRLDRLFHQISWSSDQVYRQTLQRAAEADLRVATLAIRDDIDTIAELTTLRHVLATEANLYPQLHHDLETILATDRSLTDRNPTDCNSGDTR